MRRLACALLVAGCAAQAELPPVDTGLAGLEVTAVQPGLILPSSTIDVLGRNLPDPSRGAARLVLRGEYAPEGGGASAIEISLAAAFVDAGRMAAVADARLFGGLPSPRGRFVGRAELWVDSPASAQPFVASPLPVELDVRDVLEPRLDAVEGEVVYVNDAVELRGDGFLLGTGEGTTRALVSGCFIAAGVAGTCAQGGTTITVVELDALPSDTPWSRGRVAFPFSPTIAGIEAGSFTGTVRVENRLASGRTLRTAPLPLKVNVRKAQVRGISPGEASLGQYVAVDGGGFVGAGADEVTLLRLTGSFTRAGTTQATPVDLKLVPRFESGRRLRYVLDEGDALGRTVDLRRISGRFSGTVTPIVRKGAVEVVGDGAAVALGIAPLKQVVWVRFLPSYVDSLRLYGLAAVDAAVRERVLAVAARDYAGVNVEFRTERPEDFALYATVDVAGPDPNGLGLLGYDNTTGKDVGNQRLFDRIGGVNATTQSDGFPGYGGVFAEQFLGFSRRPPPQVARLPEEAPLFDRVFDPLRPETGTPATPAEARAGVAALEDGAPCPADPRDRGAVLACAVFVLGNLIGTTLTHEVGHSLGLADPEGDRFHDVGDAPNRLMDAGDGRPFEERAEVMGQGPAVFCDAEFDYLRATLPGAKTAAPKVVRPGCTE